MTDIPDDYTVKRMRWALCEPNPIWAAVTPAIYAIRVQRWRDEEPYPEIAAARAAEREAKAEAERKQLELFP